MSRIELQIESKFHGTRATLRPSMANEKKGFISKRSMDAAYKKCCSSRGKYGCACPITTVGDWTFYELNPYTDQYEIEIITAEDKVEEQRLWDEHIDWLRKTETDLGYLD